MSKHIGKIRKSHKREKHKPLKAVIYFSSGVNTLDMYVRYMDPRFRCCSVMNIHRFYNTTFKVSIASSCSPELNVEDGVIQVFLRGRNTNQDNIVATIETTNKLGTSPKYIETRIVEALKEWAKMAPQWKKKASREQVKANTESPPRHSHNTLVHSGFTMYEFQ